MPKNSTLISVNHHALKLVDCEYVAFEDRCVYDYLRDFEGKKISSLYDLSDFNCSNLYKAGFSAGAALLFADAAGVEDVILCGMDCFQGDTYFYDKDAPRKNHPLTSQVEAWQRVIDETTCNVWATSGPLIGTVKKWQ